MNVLERFALEEVCPVSDSCIPGFVAGAYWGWGEARNRIASLLKKFSGSGVPESAVCFFRDGDKMCAVYGDFINLQESQAGFGDDFVSALDALQKTGRK